jgi:hypothetical protein
MNVMNNALYGLGCACEKPISISGLGVTLTRQQVENFFIGPNKYVRNTRETPLYKNPGEAPFTTVDANDNMGKVVRINDNLKWGKLDSGYWIFLADSMYTIYLTTPPPTSIVDAVGRELKNVASFSVQNILTPVLITAGVVVGAIYFGKIFIESKAQKVAATV